MKTNRVDMFDDDDVCSFDNDNTCDVKALCAGNACLRLHATQQKRRLSEL